MNSISIQAVCCMGVAIVYVLFSMLFTWALCKARAQADDCVEQMIRKGNYFKGDK